MNLNQLAIEICKREAGKKQVDIAQVKEILKVLIGIFSEEVRFTSSLHLPYFLNGGFWKCFEKSIYEHAEKDICVVTKIDRKKKSVTIEPLSQYKTRKLGVKKTKKKKK